MRFSFTENNFPFYHLIRLQWTEGNATIEVCYQRRKDPIKHLWWKVLEKIALRENCPYSAISLCHISWQEKQRDFSEYQKTYEKQIMLVVSEDVCSFKWFFLEPNNRQHHKNNNRISYSFFGGLFNVMFKWKQTRRRPRRVFRRSTWSREKRCNTAT